MNSPRPIKSDGNPAIPLITFVSLFILSNFLRNEWMETFLVDGKIAIATKYVIITSFNCFYTLAAFWAIKKYNLLGLAGLSKTHSFKNWLLTLFPLYIASFNVSDALLVNYSEIPTIRYLIIICWAVSVGLSEEFLLRGFVQSLLIRYYGSTKRGVVISVISGALLFGLLHLVKFDKGLYGELSQVLYSTFIGTMFGAILIRTHKLWPLVVMHALIDIIGNIDKFQVVQTSIHFIQDPWSAGQSILTALVTLPCFIYGLILMRRVNMDFIKSNSISS